MLKDLTETLISVAVAIALIAITYYALAAWLISLITGAFDLTHN